jgi:hypothetical protein
MQSALGFFHLCGSGFLLFLFCEGDNREGCEGKSDEQRKGNLRAVRN